MSESITFKLQADESGALNALKRVRSEVLNNEQGLKKLAAEGKSTGKALRDIGGLVGGPLGQIGAQVDAITGALKDTQGAGLAVKAGLVGVVATAGFAIGKMIGDWAFQTSKWTEEMDAASRKAADLQKQVASNAAARAATMTQEQLQAEIRGVSESIQRQIKQVEESDKAWSNFATADTWVIGENNRRKEVEQTKANIEAQRELLKVYQGAMKQQAERARQMEEAAEAKAFEDRMKAAQRANEEMLRSIQVQDDYLFSLEAELVKLKEGEEAYLRLTLAKKEYSQETIDAAVAMQTEIRELAELKQLGERDTPEGRDQASRITAPGSVQGTEARGLTRGVGIRGQDKILAATQKQVDLQDKIAKQLEEQNRILKERLPREVG